jgi:hypothetical protein
MNEGKNGNKIVKNENMKRNDVGSDMGNIGEMV